MVETKTESKSEPVKDQIIHATDVLDYVDNMTKDPTYNTPSACVGYGLDVLGGY